VKNKKIKKPTVMGVGAGHYGAADTALTITALRCFGARDNTAPPLRRMCAPYNNDSGWPVNERESPALLHIFMHAVSLQGFVST